MYAHTTVVTREPEWDAQSRGRVMRLSEYDRSIDKETGLPLTEAFTNQPFVVHSDVVNYAVRALERDREAKLKEHEGDKSWMTGRTFYVALPDKGISPDT